MDKIYDKDQLLIFFFLQIFPEAKYLHNARVFCSAFSLNFLAKLFVNAPEKKKVNHRLVFFCCGFLLAEFIYINVSTEIVDKMTKGSSLLYIL